MSNKDLRDQEKSVARQGSKSLMLCYEGCCKGDASLFLRDHTDKFSHAKFLCFHKPKTKNPSKES